MSRPFYIHWIHLHIFVFISNVCLCANYVKEWDDNANSDSNQDSGSQTRKPQVHYGALPPPNYRKFHIHPNESLSRQYHLEDFLWTGSGDGPAPSETDGGLAWEDNDSNIKNPEPGGDGVIRVTKTMVLFRTIHTTVYPIEYTPTMVLVVVPSLISPSESYNYGSGSTPRLVTVPLVTSSPTFSLPGPGPEPGPDTTDILLSSSNNLYFGHSVPSPTPVPKSPIPEKSASVEPEEIDSNNIPPTTKTGGTEVPLPDIHTLEPNTTTTTSGYIANPLFWVLTTIKIDNDSLDNILTHAKIFESEPPGNKSNKSTSTTSKNIIFKREIERTLANVYATAFKRHLLSSLGVEIERSAGGEGGETGGNSKGEAKGGRKKRQILKFNSSEFEIETKLKITKIKDREEIDYDTGSNNNTEAEVETEFYSRNKYFSGNNVSSNVNTKTTNGLILGLILRNSSLIPSNNPLMMQMQRNRRRALALVAATVLNVTVTVVNMSQVDSLPQMNLNYIVWAEGNPVPASSAVEDLQMVTQEEMEKEIGYEVVNKAEALVASPLKEPKVELATSPWLIVAMVSIAFVIILLVVLMLMIWKWKSNRLGSGDSSGRSRIVTPPPILRGRPESGSRSRHVDVDIETTSSAGGQGSGIDNLAFLGPPSPIERSEVPLQWPLHRKKIEYKQQSDPSEEASDQDQDLSQGQSKQKGQGNGEDQLSHHRHYKRNHKAKSKSKTRPKSVKKSDLETIQERQSSLSTNLDRIITPEASQFQQYTGDEVDQNKKMEAKKRRSSHHKHKHISVSPSSSEGSSVSDSNSSVLSGTDVGRASATATAGNGGENTDSDKLRKKKLSKSPTSSPSEKLRKQLQTIESQLQKGSPATTVSDNQSSNSMTTTNSRTTNSQKSKKSKPKSSDMISYGNLEVCQEAIARPMSSKARKILKTKQDQEDNTVLVNTVTKHRSSKRYEREEIETVEVTTEESFHRKRKSSSTGNNGRSSGEEEKTTSSVSKDSRSRKETFSHLSSESLLSSSGGSSSSTDRESEERELEIKKKIGYLGSRGGGIATSGINTNSENPIGKMRKRFHRFLDDTFNVGADTGPGKLDDGDSHSVPEETGSTTDEFSLRPKSASFGPPKSAWGSKIKPDRRGASATSKPKSAQSEQSGRKSAVKFSENLEATRIFERETTDDSEINPNLIPSPSLSPSRLVTASGPSTVIYDDGGGHFRLNLLKPEPIFPNYPIYPDIPIIPSKGVESGSTNLNVSENRPFHPNPAIPLILAIKEEIKRFEKVKNTKESNLMTSTSGNAQP